MDSKLPKGCSTISYSFIGIALMNNAAWNRQSYPEGAIAVGSGRTKARCGEANWQWYYLCTDCAAKEGLAW